MSYVTTIDVFCDNCSDWVHGDHNRREAWRRARAQGWVKVGPNHICPVCQGVAHRCSDGTYVQKDIPCEPTARRG